MNLLARRQILAIAAVVDIALHARGTPVAAKALAGRFNVPARYFETALQALVRVNILKGVRGPKGGYELARERRRITLAEILRATGTDEEEATNAFPYVTQIIEPALHPATTAFMNELELVNIAQLCQACESAQEARQTTSATDFTI